MSDEDKVFVVQFSQVDQSEEMLQCARQIPCVQFVRYSVRQSLGNRPLGKIDGPSWYACHVRQTWRPRRNIFGVLERSLDRCVGILLFSNEFPDCFPIERVASGAGADWLRPRDTSLTRRYVRRHWQR